MPLANQSIAATRHESSLAWLSLELAGVTEAAAVAAYAWIGRGEKDDAPVLYNGEALGRGGVAVDIAVDPVDGTNYLARALGKPPSELRIFVLERPRHEQLVHEIKATGASVRMARDGDVLGGLGAMIGEGGDALMGGGGTPEGVIAACVARALGAGMWGALAPQSETEAARLRDGGMQAGRSVATPRAVPATDL